MCPFVLIFDFKTQQQRRYSPIFDGRYMMICQMLLSATCLAGIMHLPSRHIDAPSWRFERRFGATRKIAPIRIGF